MAETLHVSSIASKFGRVVRISREGRGLSQEALAELAGVSRGFVSEIERGTAVPSLETMQKLADALGEKLSYLIGQYEQPSE